VTLPIEMHIPPPLTQSLFEALLLFGQQHGREDLQLDYKSEILLDWDGDKASFANDIAAMANAKGGFIIIGVEDTSWNPIGFDRTGFPKYHELQQKINTADNPIFEPPLAFYIEYMHHAGEEFVIIIIPESSNKPHVTMRQFGGQKSGSPRKFFIYKGVIPIRIGDITSMATRAQIDEMYKDRTKQRQTESAMPFLPKPSLPEIAPPTVIPPKSLETEKGLEQRNAQIESLAIQIKNIPQPPLPKYGDIQPIFIERESGTIDTIQAFYKAIEERIKHIYNAHYILKQKDISKLQVIDKSHNILSIEFFEIYSLSWKIRDALMEYPSINKNQGEIITQALRYILLYLHQPGRYQKVSEKKINTFVAEYKNAINSSAKELKIKEIINLISNKHTGQSIEFQNFIKDANNEQIPEIKKKIISLAYLSLMFEYNDGHDLSVVKKFAGNTIDYLGEIFLKDKDHAISREAAMAICMMIDNHKAIDLLIKGFSSTDHVKLNAESAINFNLYNLSKPPHKEYFIKQMQKLIQSGNEIVAKNALDYLTKIQQENWDWFRDIFKNTS